ncbi:DUF3592 domain-containing protein [Cellulophaga sp. F20128]|uniref:DUF3592 domain-containing protein n=1 Tax=Cellulophaga sp. F20128 TaxID=2926413 RepID=UPI001FF2F826|nr:DUF3592 domain-containing protein [Cellulophaga sp. F20128]MCK0157027.1 DUF3592 domain-containing protein [Cellulophaga sp. F20128]
MEFYKSLHQFQIAGIILQLVLLPFLFGTLRRWWWAKQSMHWPKVKGVVVKGLDFPLSRIMDFLYTYEINGISYQGEQPYFANSFKYLSQKKASDLLNNYKEGKQVIVFYNPSNPKISTLEPGRKDGVFSTLLLLMTLFILGFICYYNPALVIELIDKLSK